jgi:VWFA-related protein
MRVRALTFALALLIGLGYSSLPCEGAPQDTPQPTFRVSVDRIQIGAVVTDSKGRHVTDLGLKDFTILDGGKPQRLTSCEYVRLAKPGMPSGAPPQEPGRGAPATYAARDLRRDQVRRTIVILLDDESFGTEVIPAVRGAITELIERNLQAGDLAALIRTSSGSSSLEQFTSDKRVLLESAAKIRWRPESRGNPGMLPSISGTVVGQGSSAYLVNLSIQRTKIALSYVISALRDLPGTKAVFFISQSFPIGTNWFDPSSNYHAATDVGRLIDEALRAGVVVYSVDPTPLASLTPDASYDVTREFNAQNGARRGPSSQDVTRLLTGYPSRAMSLLESWRSGLQALAEGTGGQFAADTDPAAALGRFDDDLQGYYVLTYTPFAPEKYFGVSNGQSPFRSIKIRVARSGTHVRSYAGYIARPDEGSPKSSVPAEISKALFSPFAAAGIRIDMTSIFTVPRPAAPELNVLLYIDPHDLTFKMGPEGRHNAEFDLVVRAVGERSEPAQVASKTAVLRLTDASYAEAMRMGVTYRASVPAERAGLYDVRVAVRDQGSGKIGTAREFVDVPNLTDRRIATSGVLIFNARARQGDAQAPGLAEARRFRREDILGYGCQIFNAKSATGEVRVFRDGRQVTAAAAEIVANSDGTSTARGGLPLATLAPGLYALQVVATADLGKNVAASGWTDFEIVP